MIPSEQEQRVSFAHLPLLSANMSTRKDVRNRQGGSKVRDMETHRERKLSAGMAQVSVIATAHQSTEWQRGRDRFLGLAKENRRSISEPGKLHDAGRTVQGACAFSRSFIVI